MVAGEASESIYNLKMGKTKEEAIRVKNPLHDGGDKDGGTHNPKHGHAHRCRPRCSKPCSKEWRQDMIKGHDYLSPFFMAQGEYHAFTRLERIVLLLVQLMFVFPMGFIMSKEIEYWDGGSADCAYPNRANNALCRRAVGDAQYGRHCAHDCECGTSMMCSESVSSDQMSLVEHNRSEIEFGQCRCPSGYSKGTLDDRDGPCSLSEPDGSIARRSPVRVSNYSHAFSDPAIAASCSEWLGVNYPGGIAESTILTPVCPRGRAPAMSESCTRDGHGRKLAEPTGHPTNGFQDKFFANMKDNMSGKVFVVAYSCLAGVPFYTIIARRTGSQKKKGCCCCCGCANRIVEVVVALWMLLVAFFVYHVSEIDVFEIEFLLGTATGREFVVFLLKDFFVYQVLSTQLSLMFGVFELVNGEPIEL